MVRLLGAWFGFTELSEVGVTVDAAKGCDVKCDEVVPGGGQDAKCVSAKRGAFRTAWAMVFPDLAEAGFLEVEGFFWSRLSDQVGHSFDQAVFDDGDLVGSHVNERREFFVSDASVKKAFGYF